uniref:HAT C-terminal dimerisation domain-containing protein n=1 Tax=Lactuca sativa TaxID=4236 RepID=A0A9R1WTE8_LACSA|nr:hypothetical protein LSAT_V11C900478640 [Lactuca sativa]
MKIACSASACERNWITFNQVHTKRRNRLTTNKMNSLVYIMYNKKLKNKFIKKKNLSDEVDPLHVEEVPSDDEWVADPNDNEADNGGENENGEEIGGEIGDGGECSTSRKRKGVEFHLIDEEDMEDDDDDQDIKY